MVTADNIYRSNLKLHLKFSLSSGIIELSQVIVSKKQLPLFELIMAKKGVVAFVKDFYYDPFKWSLVKSVGFFTVGVVIASECTGLEIMPAMPH